MAIFKEITIDNKKVKFKASAAIPRLYRNKFSRDIYMDLLVLEKISKSKGEVDVESLEIFENIAYIMAFHANNKISGNVTEWLEQFSTFSIYQVLPELIQLWTKNTRTMSVPLKKQNQRSGR